jgi:phosphonate transport system substrate-binding protein
MRPLIFATFLAPNMFATYAFIARYVGEHLGIGTELIVGSSFDQFERGEPGIGFLCGLPYVWLRRRDPPPIELLAAPVLHGERYAGRPIYFSDVIVRRDSPFRSFADLRGRAWAYNDRDSHSGYHLTRSTSSAWARRVAASVASWRRAGIRRRSNWCSPAGSTHPRSTRRC